LIVLKEPDPFYLESYLNKALVSNVSIYDTQKGTDKESMYHAFLNGRLSGILNFEDNKYISNGELGDGRADFSFLLKTKDQIISPMLGFIIEIKAAKNEEQMETLAKDAVAQVKNKNYAKTMFANFHSMKELRVFGIAFYKKTCKVEFESFKA